MINNERQRLAAVSVGTSNEQIHARFPVFLQSTLKRFAGFTIKTRSKHSDLRKIDSASAQILEKLNQVTQHWDIGTVPRATAARPTDQSDSSLRERYCTNLAWLDFGKFI